MKINVFEGARRIALLIGVLWTIGFVTHAIFTHPFYRVTYAVQWPGDAPELVKDCASDGAREYLTKPTPSGESIDVTLCFVAQKADNGATLVPWKKMPIIYKTKGPDGNIYRYSGPDDATPEQVAAAADADYFAKWIVKNADKKGAPDFEKIAVAYRAARSKSLTPSQQADPSLTYKALGVVVQNELEQDTAPESGGYLMAEKYSSKVSDYTERVAQSFQLDARGIKEAKESKRTALLGQWKEAMSYLFGGLAVGWVLITAIGWIVRGFMGIPRGKDVRPSEKPSLPVD